MEVAKKIKDYLTTNGISQTFIARKANISNNILSNMLKGKRRITAEEYFLICDALGKSYDFFKPEKHDRKE